MMRRITRGVIQAVKKMVIGTQDQLEVEKQGKV